MKLISLVLVCLTVFSLGLFAGGTNLSESEIQSKARVALQSVGNAGTEFYFTFVPCYEESGNNKLMLYITSTENGQATVEVKGKGFLNNVVVKANNITPVELGPGFGQAFNKSMNGSIPPEQVYTGAAIHVTSTVPIVIVACTRFNYTSDSFLPLPVQTLGTNYIVASMADMTWMYGGYSLPSETAIVAAYDSTWVTFTLGGPSVTHSGGGMVPGNKKSFWMNKGDVWVIGNDANSKEGDVSGSVVEASHPVGVVSGNQCANVPTTLRWCDFISEMEIPTSLWGTNVQVPKYASRVNGYFMKVFAKEANTKVYYNGSYWKTIQTVGGQEGRGWIYQRVDGSGNNVLSLSADKPIGVTVFNTGQEDDNVSTDPFQMVVAPTSQYQKNIVFTTPGSKGGIGFTRNFMGIIFQLDESTGGMPSDLEFGVATNGDISWRKLSAVFGPSFSTKDIFQQKVNGKTFAFKECVLPSDNHYEIRCSTPFMAYLYGGSDYDSYGHPASILGYTSTGDTVAPAVVYDMNCDGSVGTLTAATVIDLPADASVRSNLSIVYMKTDSSFNYIFEVGTIQPGISSQTTWKAHVIDPMKNARAVLFFVDLAGNVKRIVLDYKAVFVQTNRPNVDFGTTPVNVGVTQEVWIRNTSAGDAVVTRLELKNAGAGAFAFSNRPPLPFTLKKGDSVSFTLQFKAIAPGTFIDTVGVGTDCLFNYSSTIIGRATQASCVGDLSDNNRITISPNPASSILRIEFDGAFRGKVNLELFDARGNRVVSSVVPDIVASSFAAALDVSSLAPGTYRLRVSDSHVSIDKSIVVTQ